jgi:hypothetical protein
MLKLTSPARTLALVIGAAVAIACSDSTEAPFVTTNSPLSGLTKGATNDSAPAAPGTPVTAAAGSIHGTVRGQSAPGSGPDTMATAPRIANVKVTAYKLVGDGATATAGEQVAAATTNANGEFTLPTLPSGSYYVTFVPPSDSKYRGQYVFGPVNSQTDRYPWYIVLSNK